MHDDDPQSLHPNNIALLPSDDLRKTKLLKGARLRSLYAQYHASCAIDDHLILWEVQKGAGMGCSPLAMFNQMITQTQFDGFSHIWVVNSKAERDLLAQDYAHVPNLQFIRARTDAYLQAICSAKYIVDNVSQPQFFAKKPGQIIVNTWHSVTIKSLGFDMPNGAMNSRNMLRSFMMTDYLISPNAFMTDVFKTGFKLDGAFSGQILETGFPRVDCLVNGADDDLLTRLAARGVHIDPAKRVVLYAPTWRGDALSNITSEYATLTDVAAKFQAQFDPNAYQLLIKPHVVSYRAMKKAGDDLTGFIPPEIDTNPLLSCVDVLISDYSSIFIDYLITDRPIIFYIPDEKTYRKERGALFAQNDLPGPVCTNIEDTLTWVKNSADVQKQFVDSRAKTRDWACAQDDGQASARVLAAIFGPDGAAVTTPAHRCDTAKTKLLIYGARFNMNGLSTSLITLLKTIDYAQYDVTLYVLATTLKIQTTLLSWVPKQVRILSRIGETCWSEVEKERLDQFMSGTLDSDPLDDDILGPVFAREYKRCFGDAQFDVAIDYSGYNVFWSTLLRQAKANKTIIWQHSDMKSDVENRAKDPARTSKFPAPTVPLLANLYAQVDQVVSCSSAILAQNQKAFATDETQDKFTYLNNLVDVNRVKKGMKHGYCYVDGFTDRYNKSNRTGLPILTAKGKARTLGFYADASPHNRTGKSARRTDIPLPNPKNTNFVTIGRYSPEKNHIALLKAFSKFCTKHENARLYVIGDGTGRAAYEKLIKKLDLTHRVYLTGNLKNPFGLAAQCDCFVLPSLYEGMGLVAIEARLMKLPTILSDFAAVSAVRYPTGQLMVGKTVSEIYRGLSAFHKGAITQPDKMDVDADIAAWRRDFAALLQPNGNAHSNT